MKPEDFKLNAALSDFLKINTLVIFVDNSYTTDELGNHSSPSFDEGIFKIIEANKAFPNFCKREDVVTPINNMKVQNIVTGKIYHCSNINVRSLFNGKIDGFDTVIYKDDIITVNKLFTNPFPFL